MIMADSGSTFNPVAIVIMAVTIYSFGISLLEILLLAFGQTYTDALFSLDYNKIFEHMLNSFVLQGLENISANVAALLAWGIASAAGGARLKHPISAALASLISVVGVVGTLIVFNPSIFSNSDQIVGFALGSVVVLLLSLIASFSVGRALYEKPVKSKPKRSRKAWKKKELWKCSQCGADLPPGALTCPECGAGVLE